MDQHAAPEHPPNAVAIIGMTGRFPGAPDLSTFWANLRDGIESITHCSDEELEASGVDTAVSRLPNFVKAFGSVDDVDMFDAGFFGYTPLDALLMDPQQRLFLQLSWHVLELAGYDPDRYPGLIGVYGGASPSSYMARLFANAAVLQQANGLSIAMGNELPFLTTRVSYKLDLRGPSCPVQTACSTSLVAVHLACQGLLNAECDIALAGGVSIRVPQKMGYFFIEDGILSPDGHCRPFDAQAQGTVFTNGLGIVALKRLDDALADGDSIHAVIRGSAINNDGSQKASFTAPGVRGQSDVIADALSCAEVEPETIGYIETHGTATSLGDSIEIQALKQAFASCDAERHRCALGAVKGNIGHLDAAAGIASLIKTVLAMQHKQLPPVANFERPNPHIPFESTPFFVNAELKPWQKQGNVPRRAGVSSFGFGGTNAHLVLEEAPELQPTAPAEQPWQVLPISARTEDALQTATSNLAAHLKQHPPGELADVAFTLQMGRRAMPHRRVVIARDWKDAISAFEGSEAERVFSGVHCTQDRSVVFLFPGQGAQHVGMSSALYGSQPVFTQTVDECVALLQPLLGMDLREVLYPVSGDDAETTERLTRTSIAQPALFVVEYALARMWMSWNVKPAACLGHSIGEYVAACLAEVLTLPDALHLVVLRGRLMESMPAGVMLALPLSESELMPYLTEGLWLAAINGPHRCVVSGTDPQISELEAHLCEQGIEGRRLHASHAFHSGLMDEAVPRFVEAVGQRPRQKPRIPYISNVTGDWITERQVLDVEYWGQQLRQPVRFAEGVERLLEREHQVLFEVGPRNTLATLVRQQTNGKAFVLSTLPSIPRQPTDEWQATAVALGRLWTSGVAIDWEVLHTLPRRRVPLPTYPFEKVSYWVEQSAAGASAPAAMGATAKLPNIDDWLYEPTWIRADLAMDQDAQLESAGAWLVFLDDHEMGRTIVERLRSAGCCVVTVVAGDHFACITEDEFQIAPAQAADYTLLMQHLERVSKTPTTVVYLWGIAPTDSRYLANAETGLLESLLYLTQSLGQTDTPAPPRMVIVTSGAHEVVGGEPVLAETGAVSGLARVIPQEYPGWTCKCVDVRASEWHAESWRRHDLPRRLLHEACYSGPDASVAYRGRYRWVQSFQPLPLAPSRSIPRRLRPGGSYWITGGLGDIGLKMAEYLAETVNARLVLTGRTGLPGEEQWDTILRTAAQADATAQRIRRLRRLQERGAEVLVLRADASDAVQMRAAWDAAIERFGQLDGVIHAAGLVSADQFLPIVQTDKQLCLQQLRPKLEGLRVLADLLRQQDVDFCLLVSSLSAILGGLGYAAYASANAAIDAFAYAQNQNDDVAWITVNWDSWLRVEDEARMQQSDQPIAGFSMTAAEGIGALHRILSHEVGPQIIVSSGNLGVRIEQWVKVDAFQEPVEAESTGSLKLPRPTLQTEYVAPCSASEKAIADIWQSSLGIDKIGIDDSFFELGGDSLTGLQMMARIKQKLAARVSAVSLFEAPTVRAMAQLIDAPRERPGESLQESRSRGARRRDRRQRRQAPAAAAGEQADAE